LDVNASGVVADWLIGLGHDVVRVSDADPRMSDEDVLHWAVREGRVILTTDLDFEEMIWREGRRHCGLLRVENLPREQRQRLLEETLSQHAGDLQSGAIVIATRRHTRVRRP